jgi:hypothetical protein
LCFDLFRQREWQEVKPMAEEHTVERLKQLQGQFLRRYLEIVTRHQRAEKDAMVRLLKEWPEKLRLSPLADPASQSSRS